MLGALNMNNNEIGNVADPTFVHQAPTKQYEDNAHATNLPLVAGTMIWNINVNSNDITDLQSMPPTLSGKANLQGVVMLCTKAQKDGVPGPKPQNFFPTAPLYIPGKAHFEILCINEVLDKSEKLNRSLY